MLAAALLLLTVAVGVPGCMLAWSLLRLWISRRSAMRLGLVRASSALWQARVQLHADAADAYRAVDEEIVVSAPGAAPRRLRVTAVRGARWVRDPQRRWAPRLEARCTCGSTRARWWCRAARRASPSCWRCSSATASSRS